MTPASFAFTKWYIDCLDREGRLVIVYWTSLDWRRLRLTWHSVIRCVPGAPVRARSSVAPCPPPTQSANTIHWGSSRLDCDIQLDGVGHGIAPQRLADGLTWSCAAPGARTTVRLGDSIFRGTGYAELIELRVPPWQLGIEQLRWGRWIGDDAATSLVWIEWNADKSNRWVFIGNQRAKTAGISEAAVFADDATLTLDAPTVVIDRGLGHTINRIPALRAVAPRWLVGGREERRTRAGTLRRGAIEMHGTAVDEIVEFG